MVKFPTWILAVTRVAVLACIVATSACGGGGTNAKDAGMQPTITIDEANRRVEEYISRVAKVLPPEAHLELGSQELRGDCSDPTDNGPTNRVIANRSFNVLGLNTASIPSYFDTLRNWWLANDFRVLDNNPPNGYLWVENNADGFQMTLQANNKGQIFLDATSPCVWPNGTPESTT